MDKKPYIYIEKRRSNKNKKKPSKVLMGFTLIITFLLPYALVNKFSHQTHTHSIIHPISLPELEIVHAENKEERTFVVEEPKLERLEKLAKIIVPDVVNGVKPIQKSDTDTQWQTINPRAGDSMATLFKRLGLSAKNLALVMHKNPHLNVLTAIKPSQKLKFLIKNNKLEQLIIPMNSIQTLTVYRKDAVYNTKVESKPVKTQERYIVGTVKGSLFTTAQHLGLPRKLIQQMTTILRKEIDFSRAVQTGDQFSIAYESLYVENKMVGVGDVLAISYTNHGKTVQAISHVSRNGHRDFYTPKGESFKKAFSRYPIKFSHISSTFSNSRYHPLLRYKRAHKGIDLAAPIGTPIQATGDGVIATIGRHNGYGNMIEIKHDKTYSTVYGHMLRFAKGLSKGSRVKREQVIGYVGQTGLATGPHCHFELHVHNQPKNPTTTYLPTASPVPAREMAAFRMKTHHVFAHLQSIKDSVYASKNNTKKTVKLG